jgi:hypothetical protein
MARLALQAEIRKLLFIDDKKGRQKLSKIYCNEIVLHTGEIIDALQEYYLANVETTNISFSKSDIGGIFKRGAKVLLSTIEAKINEKKDVISTADIYATIHMQRFGGDDGLVIYMTEPKILNFESPSWKGARGVYSKGRDACVNAINKELEEKNLPIIVGKNDAKAAIMTGHHGGTKEYDPKTGHGLPPLQQKADQVKDKFDKAGVMEATLQVNFNDDSTFNNYSELFWWNMYDVLEKNKEALWEVDQVTNRPNESVTRPASIDDQHVQRIVYGPVSANIMNPYDRSGKSKFAVGRALSTLIIKARNSTEREVKAWLATMSNEIVDFEASPSAGTRTRKLAAETVVNALSSQIKKNKKVKVTSTSDNAKGGKRRVKVQAGQKKNKKQKGRKKGARSAKFKGVAAKPARGTTRSGRTAAMNPIGLKSIIQKALPETVERNMGLPALVNRTGRFRQSAEIQDVIPMPKSVEIRYSYQTDPYSVFEPGSGNPLANRNRDPRAIIGSSIREIAQSIMGTKYGIVRTKRV